MAKKIITCPLELTQEILKKKCRALELNICWMKIQVKIILTKK